MFSKTGRRKLSLRQTRSMPLGISAKFLWHSCGNACFPKNRLAQFNLSYDGNSSNSLTVVGTNGTLELGPASTFGKGLTQKITIGERKEGHSFKNTDHLGEMKYFSECILNNESPEPNGEEDFADVRVLEGIMASLESRRFVQLPPLNGHDGSILNGNR